MQLGAKLLSKLIQINHGNAGLTLTALLPVWIIELFGTKITANPKSHVQCVSLYWFGNHAHMHSLANHNSLM